MPTYCPCHRLVDGEEKSSMSYLYEAMDKAKETIKARFKNRISQYMPYLRVIDSRWDKQLSSPLYIAGCLLNPSIFLDHLLIEKMKLLKVFLMHLQDWFLMMRCKKLLVHNLKSIGNLLVILECL